MPEGTSATARTVAQPPRKRLLADELSPASVYVNAVNMEWQETKFPGIRMKELFNDGNGFQTLLLKMEPGAEVPLHEHQGVEQTYVLEGTFQDDEGETLAGNFVWRPAGNTHVAWAGPNGATVIGIFVAPNHFAAGQKFFTEKSRD
jgi:anti-sigma factor ChrR (cupin superfamily)